MRFQYVFLASMFVLAGCGDDADTPSDSNPGSGGVGGSGAGGGAATGGSSATGGSAATAGSGTGGLAATGGSGALGGTGGLGGGSGSGGTGGGGVTAPSRTGPASASADGVLTNHPEFQFIGNTDLVITSAYFMLMQLPSFNSLLIWGDVENRGQAMLCIPLGDLSVAGVDILTVIDGPAYKVSSTVTSACVPPGGKAAFKSIQNQVSATLLSAPTSVIYSFSALDRPEAVRHPDEPAIIQTTIGPVTSGWGVSGIMQTRANQIHNFGIDVYARDTSGLLFDDTSAYPGDLGTLPVSTQMPFETYPVEHGVGEPIDGAFAGFELYTSFIEGPSTSQFSTQSADFSRSSQYAQRRTQFTDARHLLRQDLSGTLVPVR